MSVPSDTFNCTAKLPPAVGYVPDNVPVQSPLLVNVNQLGIVCDGNVKLAHAVSSSATVQLYVHASPPVKVGYVLSVTGSLDVHLGASSVALIVKVKV